MKLNSREKRLIVILVIGLMLLITKSSLEGYDINLDSQEYKFYQWTSEKIEKEYDGFLYETGIVKLKIISIKTIKKDDGDYYVAKIRKYLIGLFPFTDIFIKDKILNH